MYIYRCFPFLNCLSHFLIFYNNNNNGFSLLSTYIVQVQLSVLDIYYNSCHSQNNSVMQILLQMGKLSKKDVIFPEPHSLWIGSWGVKTVNCCASHLEMGSAIFLWGPLTMYFHPATLESPMLPYPGPSKITLAMPPLFSRDCMLFFHLQHKFPLEDV